VGNCGVDRWEIRLTVSQSVYLSGRWQLPWWGETGRGRWKTLSGGGGASGASGGGLTGSVITQ